MASGDTSRPNRNNDPSLTKGAQDINELERKVDELEKKLASVGIDLDQVKKSEGSLFKKIAVILGVVGGLIAIPKGVIDSVSAIRQRPRTTMDWGAPLTIHYDAKARLLRLGFPLALNNQGNADDTLERLTADIRTVPDKSRFSVAISDFELTLGQTESTVLPFPITPHQPKQLHVNLVLPSPFSEQALSFEGQRAVTVTFATANAQTITHTYCFDLDKDQSAEVLVSRDKNIRTPDCD
jgi:hypothetical protein